MIFSYLDLLLPSLDEQTTIGDFLYLIHRKIALNHCINGELEGMAKLLYDCKRSTEPHYLAPAGSD